MTELAKALLAFQKDPPPVHLDATNPHFKSKYASLSGVVAAVRGVLTKHGLVVTQLPSATADGSPALETRLIHADSGEELVSVMPLMPTKQDPQAQGSALTYARRYALLSMLGLVADEDDDANHATSYTPPQTHSEPQPQRQAPDAPSPGSMEVAFGKHKGKLIRDVPRDYWEWWLASDMAAKPNFSELRAEVELWMGLEAAPAGGMVPDEDIPFAWSDGYGRELGVHRDPWRRG